MQKFLRHSRKWSALFIVMMIVVLLSVFAIGFLEKVLSMGKTVKNIEFSTQAFYNTSKIIEQQLFANTDLKRLPWTTLSKDNHSYVQWLDNTRLDIYTLSDSDWKIPQNNYGNSPFNDDFNIISLNDPIQIVVPQNMAWDDIKITFQVPKIWKNATTQLHENHKNEKTFLWTYGNKSAVFYAHKDAIFSPWEAVSGIILWMKEWVHYTQNAPPKKATLSDINRVNREIDCWWLADYGCTLKISMLQPIVLESWVTLPFLEYKIENLKTRIPLRFMTFNAESQIRWYFQKQTLNLPQITTNTALDFAVLQ